MDQINNFEQFLTDSIRATWERITKLLTSIPDHKITDESLVEIYYRVLANNCKVVATTIIKGPFLDCTLKDVAQGLVSGNMNYMWGTREKPKTKISFTIGTN